MLTEAQVVKTIAYIQDGDRFFQVLNDELDDWNEDATVEQYETFRLGRVY